MGAGVGQRGRRGQPDAAAPAGHQRAPAVEAEGGGWGEGDLAHGIPRTQVFSFPPCGGGLGRGVLRLVKGARRRTPTPDPSPQEGEGSRAEFVVRALFRRLRVRHVAPAIAADADIGLLGVRGEAFQDA